MFYTPYINKYSIISLFFEHPTYIASGNILYISKSIYFICLILLFFLGFTITSTRYLQSFRNTHTRISVKIYL